MQKEELFEEIDTTGNFIQRHLGFSSKSFALVVFGVLFFLYYLGIIFYGTNSLQMLVGLKKYKKSLQTEIANLKDKNAELQHEYFDLKEATAQ